MPDWSSPAEIAKDSEVFQKMIYCLFGLYVWEIFQTCDFEWSLITRKRKFTWPMVSSFFFCRYCMLLSLIGLIISFNVTTEVNCGALYTFNSWSGNMAILCASTSLMIRTIAIWERRIYIMVVLGVLCIAHWALLYHGIFIVRSNWDAVAGACIVDSTNPTFLRINFFYTMVFDLVILVLTTTALLTSANRSSLWHLLFRDGLVYWAITFSVNAIPAILNSLDLNTVMNIIATVPAATVSTIASCRCVVRLQEFSNRETNVHSSVSATQRAVNGRIATRHGVSKPPRFAIARPEVQIVTEHITIDHTDYALQDITSSAGSKSKVLDLENGSSNEDVKYDRDTDSDYRV